MVTISFELIARSEYFLSLSCSINLPPFENYSTNPTNFRGIFRHHIMRWHVFTVRADRPCTTPKLEDHTLSAVCDSLFSTLAVTVRTSKWQPIQSAAHKSAWRYSQVEGTTKRISFCFFVQYFTVSHNAGSDMPSQSLLQVSSKNRTYSKLTIVRLSDNPDRKVRNAVHS
jgi:hypothetical protein